MCPALDIIEIADSLAITCNDDFLKTNLSHLGKTFYYHQLPILPEESTLCGELAVYFCITRMLNIDLPYEEVLNICFTADPKKNQQRVKDFFLETWKMAI